MVLFSRFSPKGLLSISTPQSDDRHPVLSFTSRLDSALLLRSLYFKSPSFPHACPVAKAIEDTAKMSDISQNTEREVVPERGAKHDNLEAHSYGAYNAAANARVRRKLDWNIMPLFFVLCK